MDEPYVKLYINFVFKLAHLSPTAKNVFLGMLYFLDEDNTVDISSHRREQMLQMLDIKKQTLANGLVELNKQGVISRLGNNYFKISDEAIKKPALNDYKP